MFDPAWVGVPLAVVGITFMILFGRLFLPKDPVSADDQRPRRKYRAEFHVKHDSRLDGKTLEASGLIGAPGSQLLSIQRDAVTIAAEQFDQELAGDDLLTFAATPEALTELWRTNSLIPHLAMAPMETERHTHHLVKVVVSRRSNAVGRRVKDLPQFNSPYRYKIVAMSRDGEPVGQPLENTRVLAGDNAILEVNDRFIYLSQIEHDFSLTKPLDDYHLQRTDRAIEASLITLAMIFLVAMGWMSMLNASLLATGAMLVTGCLTIPIAARSIDWGTLAVIAAAIGLESAVTRSGLAEQIASLLAAMGGDNPHIALAVVFLGCCFMTNVITNNAAAAFMFPIALSTASQLSVSFMPFAITMMVSASCAFITPTGYQTNLMVWAPGGYEFTDFVKIGVVMTVLVAVITILLTPMVYPF
jgi:di/tricarboxylate transporter